MSIPAGGAAYWANLHFVNWDGHDNNQIKRV